MLQGLKRQELRDELYMQLVKQTRSNPVSTSRARAWALFHLVASAMPPSKEFTGLISEYVHTALQVSNYAWHWVGLSGELHSAKCYQGRIGIEAVYVAPGPRAWRVVVCG
jgi:hypothetical protein